MDRIFLLAVLILIIMLTNAAVACEGHAYARLALGKQGQWLLNESDWEGENNIAAVIAVGYRAPINDWLSWQLEAEHHSHLDRGRPFTDETEDELDSITLGIQIKLEN